MAIQSTQPSIRFSKVQPEGMAGISFAPKIFTVELDVGSTGVIEVCRVPAGTIVFRADAWVVEALDTGTVELGSTGDADGLIDTADYTETSLNAHATNVGSAAATPEGIFFPTASRIVATVSSSTGGGIASGLIRFVIQSLEMGNMFDTPHISI